VLRIARAEAAGLDGVEAVWAERYAENIVPFDDEVYSSTGSASGTCRRSYSIAEEKIAEAPYSDLAHATERFLVRAAKFKK
jgi:hypothetical protein